MQGLSPQELLRAWERGHGRHVLDRAMLVLAEAFPDEEWADVAGWSVGQRNVCLFALRKATFGPTLRALADCPACASPLEFDLDVAQVCGPEDARVVPETMRVQCGAVDVVFRAPTSRDLAAAALCPDAGEARTLLVERCVVSASDGGIAIAAASLSDEALLAISDHLFAADPCLDLRIGLDCPACEHHWSAALDIASFLWAEVSAEAKRLLLEIHTLARAYGWREDEILALSAVRRQGYIELAS